jgi:hypothetical protein
MSYIKASIFVLLYSYVTRESETLNFGCVLAYVCIFVLGL